MYVCNRCFKVCITKLLCTVHTYEIFEPFRYICVYVLYVCTVSAEVNDKI